MIKEMIKEINRQTPQQKYFKEKRDEGLIRVTAWIPPADRQEILDIAKDMRVEYLRKGGPA